LSTQPSVHSARAHANELEPKLLLALASGLTLEQAANAAGVWQKTSQSTAKSARAHARELEPKICLALGSGLTLDQAARASGISHDTLKRWRDDMPEFAAKVDAARDIARQDALDRLKTAGKQDWRAISEWLRLTFAEYRIGNGPTVNVGIGRNNCKNP